MKITPERGARVARAADRLLGERVRCQCGYVMRRRADHRLTLETWPCFTWHHRTTGEQLNFCPRCGVATSSLSTSPAGAALARGGQDP